MFTADINADGKVYGEKNVYTQYPSERLGLRVYERTSRAIHTHMIRKQGFSNLWQTLDIAIVKHTYIRNWIDTADTADTKFNSNSFSLCFSHITIQSETTAKHTIKMRIKPNK